MINTGVFVFGFRINEQKNKRWLLASLKEIKALCLSKKWTYEIGWLAVLVEIVAHDCLDVFRWLDFGNSDHWAIGQFHLTLVFAFILWLQF